MEWVFPMIMWILSKGGSDAFTWSRLQEKLYKCQWTWDAVADSFAGSTVYTLHLRTQGPSLRTIPGWWGLRIEESARASGGEECKECCTRKRCL